jgi:hypothetical protein
MTKVNERSIHLWHWKELFNRCGSSKTDMFAGDDPRFGPIRSLS